MPVHRIEFEGQRYELEAPDDDWIGAALAGGRPYEPHLVSWAARFTPPGTQIIDAGAYIGNHAIFWALRLGSNVLAFEPNPAAASLLRRNAAVCAVDHLVDVHEVALGADAGRGHLADHVGTNYASQRIEVGRGSIDVTTIDHYEARPALIKIDVEGLEADVVKGAFETIQRCRPVMIVEDNDPHELRALMRKLGYHRVPLDAAWTPTFIYAPDWKVLRRIVATAPYGYIFRRRRWRLARRLGIR